MGFLRELQHGADCFELNADEVSAMEALDSGTRSYWDNSGVP